MRPALQARRALDWAEKFGNEAIIAALARAGSRRDAARDGDMAAPTFTREAGDKVVD